MTNTIEETYKGLVKKYQNTNRKNAEKIGRAAAKLIGVIAEIEVLIDRRDYILPNDILKNLKYIQKNINEIEF